MHPYLATSGAIFAGAFMLLSLHPVQAQDRAQAMHDAEMASLSDKLAQISDPALRDQLSWARFGYAIARDLDLASQQPLAGADYRVDQSAVILHYPDLDAYANSYAANLRAIVDEAFDFQSIDVRRPFDYAFYENLQWTSLRFTDGQSVPILPDLDESVTGLQAYGDETGVYFDVLPSGRLPIPQTLSGTLTMRVPTSLDVLTFANPTTGAERSVDDFVVTITARADHYAEVTLSYADGSPLSGDAQITVVARDAEGSAFSTLRSSTTPISDLDAYGAQLTDAIDRSETDTEGAWDIVNELLETDEQTAVVRSIFAGEVDTLTVYLADLRGARLIERSVDLPVVDATLRPATELPPDIPMPVDVIDPDLLVLTDGTAASFSAEEVLQKLLVWQDYDRIRFALPPRVSDLFVGQFTRIERAGNLAFSGGLLSGTIDVPHDNWRVYDFGPKSISFLEPELFPTPPRRVAGDIRVNIVTDLRRDTFPLDALPEGLTVSDNRVTLTTALYRDLFGRIDEVGSGARLIALNADGLPLKRFRNHDSDGGEIGEAVTFYHHGNPASILILRRGVVTPVIYPLDLRLSDMARY